MVFCLLLFVVFLSLRLPPTLFLLLFLCICSSGCSWRTNSDLAYYEFMCWIKHEQDVLFLISQSWGYSWKPSLHAAPFNWAETIITAKQTKINRITEFIQYSAVYVCCMQLFKEFSPKPSYYTSLYWIMLKVSPVKLSNLIHFISSIIGQGFVCRVGQYSNVRKSVQKEKTICYYRVIIILYTAFLKHK